jgi:hypothetical protein
MKKPYRLLIFLILVALAVPMISGAPARAQVGQPTQVWLIPGQSGTLPTVEYRTSAGKITASYVIGVDTLGGPRQAAGRVFGYGLDTLPVFDPYKGKVMFYPVPGKGISTDQEYYNLTAAVPSPDGQQYAYGVILQHADLQKPATNWVFLAGLGMNNDTAILQEQTDAFLAIAPMGWSADGSTLLLHDMPQGIGGYILFWTYQNVRAYTILTGQTTLLGNLDGYSGDLQYTALVERNDSGPTGLLVTRTATNEQIRYPLPPVGEQPFSGGGAYFSPSNTKVAYQVARNDPENEKFWTVVVDLMTGQSRVVLEDQAAGYDTRYATISGWLDDNTLVVGSEWSQQSAVVDVTTGQLLREERGSYLGTTTLTAGVAPSGVAFAQCPGAPPSRLQPFKNGRITFTDGTLTNVRQSPGKSGEIVARKPEGETFSVNGGPFCLDGFAWWNLQFSDNTYGFVAEGDLNAYYLEPWQ